MENMNFVKGERIVVKDGKVTREATIVSDGIDSNKKIRVKIDNFPFEKSIPIRPSNEIYFLKKMAKGGNMKHKMAKGGVTEHGLRKGDSLGSFKDNKVIVYPYNEEEQNSVKVVNINKGKRIDAKDYIKMSKKEQSKFDKMAKGGGVNSKETQQEIIERLDKEYDQQIYDVKLQLFRNVNSDKILQGIQRDWVISPERLIVSAVRKGFITIDEINEDLWDSAVSNAYEIDEDYRDSGQGISSSDMNAFISRMLNDANIKIGVVNGRYERMAKGGKTKKDPPIVRGYFEDEAIDYGQGGSMAGWCYSIGGL